MDDKSPNHGLQPLDCFNGQRLVATPCHPGAVLGPVPSAMGLTKVESRDGGVDTGKHRHSASTMRSAFKSYLLLIKITYSSFNGFWKQVREARMTKYKSVMQVK